MEHNETRGAHRADVRTAGTVSSRADSEFDVPVRDSVLRESVSSRPGSSRVLSRFIEAKQFSECQEFDELDD